VFFQGGWGKISAAASTQYAIDRWKPELLVNLGTCGGLRGQIERGEIVLVERTLVYDIYEQMGDPVDHIAHYTTSIDLSWLGEDRPRDVRSGLLVSGDRDLVPQELAQLQERFGAMAGDWESGAIAWVAGRNHVRCLILRGVTDLVDAGGGEVYGDLVAFNLAANRIMSRLLTSLPDWLAAAGF
jgi:adenosylhomocysteine nucleosidase